MAAGDATALGFLKERPAPLSFRLKGGGGESDPADEGEFRTTGGNAWVPRFKRPVGVAGTGPGSSSLSWYVLRGWGGREQGQNGENWLRTTSLSSPRNRNGHGGATRRVASCYPFLRRACAISFSSRQN